MLKPTVGSTLKTTLGKYITKENVADTAFVAAEIVLATLPIKSKAIKLALEAVVALGKVAHDQRYQRQYEEYQQQQCKRLPDV